jgi:hypothetical protein
MIADDVVFDNAAGCGRAIVIERVIHLVDHERNQSVFEIRGQPRDSACGIPNPSGCAAC